MLSRCPPLSPPATLSPPGPSTGVMVPHPETVTGDPATITHTYAEGPNNYSISATATDDVATYSSNSVSVQVNHVPPTLAISGNATVAEAATYTLNFSAQIGPHTISSWTIIWGDGFDPQTVTGNPSSITHVYAAGPNNYTITAAATDDVATYSANTLSVQVTHVAQSLSISGALECSTNNPSTPWISPVPKSAPTQFLPGRSTGAMARPKSSAAAPPQSHIFAAGPNDFTISARPPTKSVLSHSRHGGVGGQPRPACTSPSAGHPPPTKPTPTR